MMFLPSRHSWNFDIVIALLCLNLSAPLSAKQNTATLDQAKAAMATGIEAAHEGDLAKAQAAFAKAVSLAPQVSATHAALGSIYLEEGQIEPAARELNRAYTLSPSDVANTLNLARAEAIRGNNETSISLFRKAMSDPSAPQLSPVEAVAYATALAAQGDLSSAQAALTTTLAYASDSALLHDALGVLLGQQGELAQALPQFQQAVALEPNNASAQLHLGAAFLGLNQPSDALTSLKAAATLIPQSFDAHLQLGRAYSTLGQDDDALRELHDAVAFSKDISNPHSFYTLALALQASGDASGSLPLFAQATQDAAAWKPADYTSALANFALAHVQTGDAKGALPIYAHALSVGPDSPTLREDYGVAYLQQQDLDHALEQFRAGLILDSDSAHLHYDLGLALKLKDDLAAAVPEFQHAAMLDPSLPDPAYTLGVIYMQQGKFAEAAERLQHAVDLQPNNDQAWALLGSTLRDSGDPSGAMDAFKHAIALAPNQPNLHVEIAALESQAGQREEATAERKLAADLSRAVVSHQRAGFALNSGRALLAQNKFDDALIQLNVAVQADPKSSEAHTLLADLYARQGKAADAALERSRAAELASTSKQ
jgi:tetratricopeptide (TPR) repeat protein